MTWGQRARKAIVGALKALPFPGRPYLGIMGYGGLPGERDYSRLVGDGGGNSIVAACVNWIARTFPEAPPAMWTIAEDGVRNRIPRHPMVKLLRFPTSSPSNPGGHYSGTLLWMATLVSWVLDGNAYWLKVRSGMGRVVQLWYIPHWMMEPRWPIDGSVYIDHYDYQVNGRIYPLAPQDVVHFRHGLDTENTRKGRSPLSAVLREVFSDEEAARFTASILKNLGVPGVVMSPDNGAQGGVWRTNPEEAKEIKAKYREMFGGDNRGEPMVMSGPTKLQAFGFSPVELDLSALRNVPEERITAALGLPAAVVGFGAGLQATKVGATMSELRDQAWQSNLIPTQRLMADEIQIQLLPDFESDLEGTLFGFDTSHVKILQEDNGKLAERWARLVSSGIAKRSEARRQFDLPVGPDDDIYLPQPGVRGSLEELAFIDQEEGKAPKVDPQVAQLQQQVLDLQGQQGKNGKALQDVIAGLPAAFANAIKQLPAPVVTVNPSHVTFAEGAIKGGDVHVPNQTPAKTTKRRSTVKKADGSVTVIESEDV